MQKTGKREAVDTTMTSKTEASDKQWRMHIQVPIQEHQSGGQKFDAKPLCM